MLIYNKLDIYNYNTMRLHCIVDTVIFPESIDELIDVVNQEDDFVIIAAGSNIILPAKLHKTVIILRNLPDTINIINEGLEISASCRIQKLIRFAQKNNLGGIEYLYSVPCTIGGAIYMNAGRGEIYNKSISDYVISVKFYDLITKQIKIINKEDCDFRYRSSIFHKRDWIILSVILKLETKLSDEVEDDIKKRIKHSTEVLDAKYPSAGSIFLYSDPYIMNKIKGIRIGGACWSEKTPNWIKNINAAKSWHILILIKIAQLLHRIYKKNCTREVIILK